MFKKMREVCSVYWKFLFSDRMMNAWLALCYGSACLTSEMQLLYGAVFILYSIHAIRG
jgi:hypothetical protein